MPQRSNAVGTRAAHAAKKADTENSWPRSGRALRASRCPANEGRGGSPIPPGSARRTLATSIPSQAALIDAVVVQQVQEVVDLAGPTWSAADLDDALVQGAVGPSTPYVATTCRCSCCG